MHVEDVQGHSKQRIILERLFKAGKLPHALLFSGLQGIGKKLIAKELAKAAFCSSNQDAPARYPACGNCNDCNRFDSGNIPDYYEIVCSDRSQMNTDNIRQLLYSLSLNSFTGGKRIVIFDDAEFISLQVANILLKTLEEPRNDTHFILICSNPYRLPATLLSRCQLLNFSPLSGEEIAAALKTNPQLQEAAVQLSSLRLDSKQVASLSQGSLKLLTEMLGSLDAWNEFSEAMNRVRLGSISTACEIAERVAKDKENIRKNILLLTGIARNMYSDASSNPEMEAVAACISNLIQADKLISERNISALYVLNFVLVGLATGNGRSFTALDESVSMLARI